MGPWSPRLSRAPRLLRSSSPRCMAWLHGLGVPQVSIHAFAFLFAEMVQYAQKRVNGVDELEQKYAAAACRVPPRGPALTCALRGKHRLAEFGGRVGVRMLELLVWREKNLRRETRIVGILSFIHTTVFRALFGKPADSLERSNEREDECMLWRAFGRAGDAGGAGQGGGGEGGGGGAVDHVHALTTHSPTRPHPAPAVLASPTPRHDPRQRSGHRTVHFGAQGAVRPQLRRVHGRRRGGHPRALAVCTCAREARTNARSPEDLEPCLTLRFLCSFLASFLVLVSVGFLCCLRTQPARVTAHSTAQPNLPYRTTIFVKFDASVMERERKLEAK